MTISPVFRKIFVPSNLAEAVNSTLETWFPTFIREVEAQQSLPVGKLKPPQRYTKRNNLDSVPGEDLPKCIIVAPNLIGTPVKRGNGQYEATWRIGIGIAVTGSDEDDAILHCDILAAAARDIMLKQQGEYCDNVEWIDEAYDDRPLPNATQYYRVAALWFAVTINNIATKRGGPDIPDTEPYVYTEADLVSVILTKEPING